MALCVRIDKVESIQSTIQDEFRRLGFTVTYTNRRASIVFNLLDEVGDIIGRAKVCKTAIRFDNTHTLALIAIENLKEESVY